MRACGLNVLLIEDDGAIAKYICDGLHQSGHNVEWVANGRSGMVLAIEHEFDVLIVDRLLPDMDGISIVKSLRAASISMPMLFLSALSDVDDRVDGLTSGADDYLVKPFALSELEARINVLNARQRYASIEKVYELRLGDIKLDLMTRKVTIKNTEIDIKGKEFALLEKLIRNPNRVFSRTMLMEQIWGYHFDTKTNVIDVHVSNLRKKIESISTNCFIKTVRGAGYALEQGAQHA